MRLTTRLAEWFNRQVNYLTPRPVFVMSQPIVLQPGSSIPFVDFQTKPGGYHIYVDSSNVKPGDDLAITYEIRPGPKSKLIPYSITVPPLRDSPQLWDIVIPACSGFRISFNLKAGRPLLLNVYVWSLTGQVAGIAQP